MTSVSTNVTEEEMALRARLLADPEFAKAPGALAAETIPAVWVP